MRRLSGADRDDFFLCKHNEVRRKTLLQ
jgi:hypothetical protein